MSWPSAGTANSRNQQRVKLCTMGVGGEDAAQTGFSVYLQQTGHLVHFKLSCCSYNAIQMAKTYRSSNENGKCNEPGNIAETQSDSTNSLFHKVQIRLESTAVFIEHIFNCLNICV